MKPPDRSKRLTRDEWVFLFVTEFRKLRPEVGDRYATLQGQLAYTENAGVEPEDAARAKAQRK